MNCMSATSPSSPPDPTAVFAVKIADRPRAINQSLSRISSRRCSTGSRNRRSTMSTESKTMRVAFRRATSVSRIARRPLRSNEPVATVSTLGAASRKKSHSFSSAGIFHPNVSAFATIRARDSSNATKIPGSRRVLAASTSVCKAMTVLPEPAPPTSSVARPRGNPPSVSESRPRIPVGAFALSARTDFFRIAIANPGSGVHRKEGWRWRARHRSGIYGALLVHGAMPSGIP
jgi:hypothetical protein